MSLSHYKFMHLTKSRRGFILIFFMFLIAIFICGYSLAYDISVPEKVSKDEIVIVDIKTNTEFKEPIKIIFDSAVLQYVGTAIPTNLVKLESENSIIIEPIFEESKNNKISLKFIPVAEIDVTTITLRINNVETHKKIFFYDREGKSSNLYYSILFLALAVIFAFVGYRVWIYQKKKINLMSTRSLILNLEELEILKQNLNKSSDNNNLFVSSSNSINAVNNESEKVHLGNKNQEDLHNNKDYIKYQIYIELEDENKNVYKGKSEEITLGRKETNIISIQRAEISRFHAKITYEDGKFLIKPLSSNNKVCVDNVLVDKFAELRKNQVIALGDVKFIIKELYII